MVMVAALLIATIVALALAIRRRRWLWLWGLVGALALTLASFATPPSIGVVWQSVLEFFMTVLLVFALLGPRRETAYA